MLETNKLIAEFMGVFSKISSTGNIHSWSDSPYYYTTEDSKDKVIDNISRYAKYNTSWDWLMPIIIKIEFLEDERFTFDMTRDSVIIHDLKTSSILQSTILQGTKFKACYNAVVKFIEWYDEQEK